MNRSCPILTCLALILAIPAMAQTPTGTIVGVVRDTSGGVLPGGTVTIASELTGAERILTTNGSGEYDAPFLPPSRYRVTAELKGFKKTVRSGLTLQVDQRSAVDLVLEVGALSEEVLVAATRPLLDTQSGALGTVIDNRKIVELPLNGRDFFQLSTLMPGTVPPAEGSQNATQGGAVSVNGAREQSNNFLLDGVDNNDFLINQIVLPPSVDAIDQFKVQSSAYSAEFGRSAGGQFNYVTKSGANTVHGSGYEFARNAALDARNYFDNPDLPIPRFERNQFGATLGGPLMRNRLFAFANYEGMRNKQASTRVATVPPLAWINGDFSSLLTGTKDPATGFDTGQLFNPRTGLPIAGNLIPASLRDAAGAAILKYYPGPDNAAAREPSGATVSPIGTNNVNQATVRLDQNIGPGHQLFGRYTFWKEDRFNPFDPLMDPTNVPGFGSFTRNSGQNLAVGWTKTLGARAINELRIGYNHTRLAIFQEHEGDDVNKSLGITGLTNDPLFVGRPGVILGITDALIEPINTPQNSYANTFQLVESFSWLRGRHSVKAGGDIRHITVDTYLAVFARGQFIFGGMSGNPVADLLLGVPALALRQAPGKNTNTNLVTTAWSGYLQDDWRVTDNLTLNLGLRYDYNQPPYDTEDRQSVPDFTNQYGGGFVQVGTHGIPRAGYNPDRNNLAPRLSMAWKPGGSQRTVVRGGYGVFHDITLANMNIELRFNPPYYGLDLSPAPASLKNAFSDEGVPITFTQTINRQYRDGYYHRWNVGVQRELLADTVLDLSYVGSAGRNLMMRIDPNQGRPGGLPAPYPDFGPAEELTSQGTSSYHSAQVRLERRFAGGLSLLGAYTWSSSRDISSSLMGTRGAGMPQNSSNPSAEWGPSDFDTPHRLTVSWVWDLPFGPGRRYLNRGGLAGAILGNWEFTGITTFQSGRPFTVFYGAAANYSGTDNGANGGSGLDRPNLAGHPVITSPSANAWFNVDAFAPAVNAFGNVGRNTLRGDAFSSIDLALYKNVSVSKQAKLQVRLEVFNAFNTVNFFLPVGDLTSASAGKVVRAADSRQIQLGVKVTF